MNGMATSTVDSRDVNVQVDTAPYVQVFRFWVIPYKPTYFFEIYVRRFNFFSCIIDYCGNQ